MSSQTPKLGLVLPARGEYTGTWDIPVNANSTVIDTAVGALQDDIQAAAGSEATLADRLNNAMDATGNLAPTAEVVAARNSAIYGSSTLLAPRLQFIDTEVLAARQGLAHIRDSLAYSISNHLSDCVLSPAASANYLTYTSATVSLNGTSGTPIVADINGFRQVVSRTLTTTVSGASGTYYITLNRSAAGTTFLNVASGLGTTALDLSSNITVFNDSTQNFVSLGVQVGSLLVINTTGSANNGTYVVSAVGYNSNPNNLQIIGVFPGYSGIPTGGISTYTIVNPVEPTLGFTATAPSGRFAVVSNQIYIGSVVFNGTLITGLTIFASLGHFEGFTHITSVPYTLTGVTAIAHNIGYFPSRIKFYANQTGDFTQALELLSVADINIPIASATSVTTGVTTTTTVTPSSGTATAVSSSTGTSTATTTSTATPTLLRSVVASVSNYVVNVKNASDALNIFYTDFSGTQHTGGYLFVVVDR